MLGVAQRFAHLGQQVELLVDVGFGPGPGHGFDAAHPGAHGTFGRDFEVANRARVGDVQTAAQLHRIVAVEGDDAHELAVLLAEKGHRAQAFGLGNGHVAALVERDLLTDFLVHHPLNLPQLVIGYFGEV